MRYFMAIPREWFHQRLCGSLRACWLKRSFGPAIEICRELTPSAQNFVQRGDEGESPPLTLLIARGLAFDPDRWRVLAGELMLFGSAELPELETPLESSAAVLGLEMPCFRGDFTPIQQAILGSRDLWFGACYRPDHAGWNDLDHIARLHSWLDAIEPESWSCAGLTHLPANDRDDELVFLHEWFPALRDLYRRCAQNRWVLVSEEM